MPAKRRSASAAFSRGGSAASQRLRNSAASVGACRFGFWSFRFRGFGVSGFRVWGFRGLED